MAYEQRKPLLEKIEAHTKRPLLVYVTSHRPGASGVIAGDTTRIFIDQILALPKNTNQLDLLIHSLGGDGLAAWRIISAIRERLGEKGHLRALIPHNAFSAATLLALGCDEIIMHPLACLGPVDPQISVTKPGGQQNFAYEDLLAFGDFIEEGMKVKGEQFKTVLFDHLMKEIQPTIIGLGKRSSSQAEKMSVELLKMHMDDGNKISAISAALNKSFYAHGHAVSRSQAKAIGLNIAKADEVLENLIWDLYSDFEDEMEMRKPFDVLSLVLKDASAAALLAPPPLVNLPGNIPPQVAQQVWQNVLQTTNVQNGAAVDFKLIQAAVESLRNRMRFCTLGRALVTRRPDMEFMAAAPTLEAGWESY